MCKSNLKKLEKMFLHINNKNNAPACKYCGNTCYFISDKKGYKTHCNSEICKKYVFQDSFKVKKENSLIYAQYIIKNFNKYKNISIPFYDIFLQKEVKTLKQFKILLNGNLNMFNEHRKCLYCNKWFLFNKFTYNKDYCKCKSCTSVYNFKYHDEYLNFKDIPFDVYKLNCKYKTFCNDDLRELLSKYNEIDVKKLIKRTSIIFRNYILHKNSNNVFSFLSNNIIENDMLNICHWCGKKYIKFDKIIKDNIVQLKKVGSEFSCGNKECYYHCIGLYKKSEENIEKQSKTLKEKISKGLFTPKITNSWTRNDLSLKYNNINFRSTWELYYYIFNNTCLQYERIRISYYDTIKNKNRIYIVDFYDENTNTLIEVKPLAHQKLQNFKDKLIGLKKYCNENNANYKIIDENWFKMYYNINILDQLENVEQREKIKKLLRQFERVNYETKNN